MKQINEFLEKHNAYGAFFIRLIIGFHLIYGTQDNIFSWSRMLEFQDFLQAFGFPLPLVSAVVSVYTQFFCGILIILGAYIRFAAVLMIFNFLVAILAVHLGDTYPNTFPALMMFCAALFFLLNGAGKPSIDDYRKNSSA